MEALGGSAHRGDKLTECKILQHSWLNLLLARASSFTQKHGMSGTRAEAQTHTTQTFHLQTLCKTKDLKSININIYLIVVNLMKG